MQSCISELAQLTVLGDIRTTGPVQHEYQYLRFTLYGIILRFGTNHIFRAALLHLQHDPHLERPETMLDRGLRLLQILDLEIFEEDESRVCGLLLRFGRIEGNKESASLNPILI